MNRMTSIPNLSGASLVGGFAVLVPGALLYLTRPDTGLSSARLVTERALIMAAVVLTAVGFLLLKEHLAGTAARAWVLIGAYLYLFGAVLIVTAEALWLSGAEPGYALVVTYVVLALLAQAAVGLALVQSGTLPATVGWATVAWNLAWLIILPVTTPAEIYFPVLHHLMPLVIGSTLILIVDGSNKKPIQKQES